MGSDWSEERLEDCMDAIIDYRGKTPKKTDSGIPLITAKIIKAGRVQPVSEFISEDDYDTWMRRGIPKSGDVVMTTEAPLGEVAQLDDRKIALAQRVITLRGKKGVLDNTFLKYLLISQSVQHQLDGRGTGTTVKGIKQSELREVLLKYPSYPEQKAIAHILGSLDDKIELNRQMNETLESMAQALFKSWFVDFDPVIDNAMAAGNPIPDVFAERAEQRRKLNANAEKPTISGGVSFNASENSHQSLFPSEFEFTEEMGWVPKGWEQDAIENILEINPRITLKKGTVARFADMKALPTSGYTITDVIDKEYSGGAKFQKGDVLFARITPCLENGKTGIANFLKDEEVGFGSTEFIILRGKSEIKTPFVACLARDSNFRNHAKTSMVGSSGRQRVQNACFSDYFLALPKDSELLRTFQSLTAPSFEKSHKQSLENITLTNLRDTLLPKLLSGELRIPDAEKLIEEAGL